MNPSPVLYIGLPILFLLAGIAVPGVAMVRELRQRRVPKTYVMIAFFAGVIALDGFLSFVIVINAALSHSERMKTEANWYCLALFLVLCILPAGVLVAAIRKVRATLRSTST